MGKRPTITDVQYAKLPKWAQQHLDDLNSYVSNIKHDRDRVVAQVEPTNIMVDWEVLGEKQCYIPTDSRVMFMFEEPGGRAYMRNYIEVAFDRDKTGVLNLHASGTLTIQWKYSNGCSVSVER